MRSDNLPRLIGKKRKIEESLDRRRECQGRRRRERSPIDCILIAMMILPRENVVHVYILELQCVCVCIEIESVASSREYFLSLSEERFWCIVRPAHLLPLYTARIMSSFSYTATSAVSLIRPSCSAIKTRCPRSRETLFSSARYAPQRREDYRVFCRRRLWITALQLNTPTFPCYFNIKCM